MISGATYISVPQDGAESLPAPAVIENTLAERKETAMTAKDAEDAVNQRVRHREVNEAIKARADGVNARFEDAKRIQDEARIEKDAGRLEAAQTRLDESQKIVDEAAQASQEILQMLPLANDADEQARGDSELFREKIQILAAQGTLGFASLLDALAEEDSWWQVTR
jgi:hypothetical protein